VGVYESKELLFVAKAALKALQTAQCHFKNLPEKKASRWGSIVNRGENDRMPLINPNLVCQVAFIEWTDAGHLRHFTFVAMRDDKKPTEVVRETGNRIPSANGCNLNLTGLVILKVGVLSQRTTETEIFTSRPGEPVPGISEGSLRALFVTKT
jgi:ATP dependent DNA ligase C terminal region